MSNWISGDITTKGIRLSYYRTGDRKPPLLIAHGVTDNGRSWSRVAGALAQDYDVIVYDRRGHGFSDAPDSGYTFRDHAEDMAGLITALELERPHILGHSGGAATAAVFAATHPDLPASLILEDPAWGTGWGEWEPLTEGMREWFLSTVSMTKLELVASCRQENPTWREEEISLWADTKVQVSPNVVQTFEQPALAWQEIVRQITCPILLIAGDPENAAIMTARDVEAMAAVWRDGRAVTIKGAGHMVHYDQYEAFLAAVRSFLASVDSG